MSQKCFPWRLPEVLHEAKEGKITTLNDAKKWLNEQERVDAPHVAVKRWRAIVRKRHCNVLLGGLDAGHAPPQTLLLMLRLT